MCYDQRCQDHKKRLYMRYLVLSDIHSNLAALEAVLEDAPARAAEILAAGNPVAWFQGRMEFGPRALGARSILADARSESMQKVLNLKIKWPFCLY